MTTDHGAASGNGRPGEAEAWHDLLRRILDEAGIDGLAVGETKTSNLIHYRSVVGVRFRVVLAFPSKAEVQRQRRLRAPTVLREESNLLHPKIGREVSKLARVGDGSAVEPICDGAANRQSVQKLVDVRRRDIERSELVETENLRCVDFVVVETDLDGIRVPIH